MKKTLVLSVLLLSVIFVCASLPAFAADIVARDDSQSTEQMNETDDLSVVLDENCIVSLAVLDDTAYLFLPAFADLSALTLNFNDENPLIAAGDLGEQTLMSGSLLDITSIAAQNSNGTYNISLKFVSGSELPVVIMQSSGVFSMFLTSDNISEQGREWVDISKSNEATGSMKLLSPDGEVIYDGGLTQIKPRGNSTFKYYDKKSYQIKLDKKTDLLGKGEKVKTWVLLAGYIDASQMRDKTFKDLAAKLEMPFTVSCDWTDLYYDGEYRGTYLLSEKNSVGSEAVDIIDMEEAYEEAGNAAYGDNEESQKDVNKYGNEFHYIPDLTELADISGGWLIELNHAAYDEICGFLTDEGVALNVKSPEYAGKDAMLYISEYYQEFENAVYAEQNGIYTGFNTETGKYYYDYCDKESLVKMYLLQEISGNIDAFASSLYFYKNAGEKMYAGPVWDMEASAGIGWNEEIVSTRDFLDKRYLSKALIQIPDFRQAVVDYFKNILAPEIEHLLAEEGTLAGYEQKTAGSVAMNSVLWPFVKVGDPSNEAHLWAEGTEYADVLAAYKQWLSERLTELKKDYDPFSIYYQPSDHPYFPKAEESVLISEETDIENGVHKSVYMDKTGVKTEIQVKDDGSFSLAVYEGDMVKTDYVYAGGVTAKIEEKSGERTKYSVWLPDDIEQAAVRFPYAMASIYTVASMPDGTLLPITNFDAESVVVYVTGACDIQFVENKKTFNDVGEQWYKESVAFVSARGIMNGVGENTFAPDELLSRAMLAQILYNFDSDSISGISSEFKDIPFGIWFDDAVNWASAVGLVNGFGDNTFRPYDDITREQLVTILYRYFNFKGYKAAAGNDLSAFSDEDKVSDWALDAVEWAVGNGLISGVSQTVLAPDAAASRAEAATIFMRFCILILNQEV